MKPDRLIRWLSVVAGCHMVYEAVNAPFRDENAMAALLLYMAKAFAGETTPVPPIEREYESGVTVRNWAVCP